VTIPDLLAGGAAWDGFVAVHPSGGYTQLTAWAEVKAPNGWSARRIVVPGASGPLGAQMLIRRLGPTPWSLGYVPRGPVAETFDAEGVARFTAAVREAAAARRLTHVTIEPQVPAGDPLEEWLRAAGWRRGARVQDSRTRIIDLECPEEELWAGLRSKWRQYVSHARHAGVVVVDAGSAGLPEFERLYVETARRGGFVPRSAAALEVVHRSFAARGAARLLLARLPGGEAVAGLMLLACGRRVVEPYGGMNGAGAESRANYLLKWEAIRSSRELGHASYDLWGVAHPGIEQFKAGFGGREVLWTGAWELVERRALRRAIDVGQRLRVAAARRSIGPRGGSPGAGPDRSGDGVGDAARDAARDAPGGA
jgi:peptidoglycan pentaglycine glycine transferase (the first glycine)